MLAKVVKALFCCGRRPTSLVRRNSSSVQALSDPTWRKDRQMPREISLQVLDERHNLRQIRDLLAQAFVENNEPLVNVLGEIHYPSFPTAVRIPLIEERLKMLFSDESISRKVEDGMSLVAVKDNDPGKLVSVMFAERYSGEIYKSEDHDDPVCQAGVTLMKTVHEKAIPVLEEYRSTRSLIFISHTATHPKYRALGVLENLSEAMRSRLLAGKNRLAIYCLMTSHRLASFVIQRYGFQVIAEVLYKDYEENGQKIFEQLSEKEISAKALVRLV